MTGYCLDFKLGKILVVVLRVVIYRVVHFLALWLFLALRFSIYSALLVLFLAFQFSIFSALRIRPYGPVRFQPYSESAKHLYYILSVYYQRAIQILDPIQ